MQYKMAFHSPTISLFQHGIFYGQKNKDANQLREQFNLGQMHGFFMPDKIKFCLKWSALI